jgi:hypothetical protein
MTYTSTGYRVARLVVYTEYHNGHRLTVILGSEPEARPIATSILTGEPGAARVVDELDNLTGQTRIVIDHGKVQHQ